jgi:hypothetical protein
VGLPELLKASTLRDLQVLSSEGRYGRLLDHLRSRKPHKATDPRDKVYALLGISDGCQDGVFVLDYDIPTGQVLS